MISINNLSDLLKGLSISDLFEEFEPFDYRLHSQSQQKIDRDECDIPKEPLNERIQKELEKLNKKENNENKKEKEKEDIELIKPKKIHIVSKPIRKIVKKPINNIKTNKFDQIHEQNINNKINEVQTSSNDLKHLSTISNNNENLIKRESIKCEIDKCKNYHNEIIKKINMLKSEDDELNKRIKQLEDEYSLIKIDILEEIKQKYIKKYSLHNLMYFEDFEELYNELKKNKDLNIEIIEDKFNKYSILVEGGGIDDDTILQIRIMKRMFSKIVENL